MKNETPKDKRNRLRTENEEKKKKIEEEFGAGFWGKSEDSELSPELESQFLDHIMSFENAWKDAKQTTLYEFLGKPSYRKPEELSPDEIHDELNRLNELMEQHQVELDTICEVSEQELYRFITEELFSKEIDDMHIPGMITHYTYEEFHPNHEHDIRQHSVSFVSSYLNKESDYYSSFLSGIAQKDDWHLHFRQAFSSFHLNDFSIKKLEFDTKKAKVQFECNFVGKVEGSPDSLLFKGNGEMRLIFQWDFWCVDKIQFPKSLVR
ncbi:MAG: hypothetical protein ACOYMD_10595 [Paludibacter sp.]